VLDHAAFIIVQHLHITRASDAGIILREGSHDNVVRDNTIENTRLGIWLGQGAGLGNRIDHNAISHSETHGIALDGMIGEPRRETIIADNVIKDSGIHGIEIRANYTRIDQNIVSGSGRLSTGASGIHVFAKSANDGFGTQNLILGNRSFDNHDASAQDGNGIQLDQWCNDNSVSGNMVEDNDGAGISVFDAARATISGNTIHANMRDPGHSHRHKGELVFASDDVNGVDNTRDAMAAKNIIDAENPQAAAILVDVPTSRHPPIFRDNQLEHEGHGPIARWAGRDITSIATWNVLAPHSMPDRAPKP
jgi:parallel beta-helix repeat protein